MTIPTPLLFDFANTKRLNPLLNFTRTSSATFRDFDGTWREVPANTPRFSFDETTGECLGILIEGSRTNLVENPRFEGTVAGTPGTAPSNYTSFTTTGSGITRQIVGFGKINGLPYIDVRYYGTPSSTTGVSISSASNVVSAGTIYTNSAWFALVGGSTNNISLSTLRCAGETGGTNFTLNSTLTRVVNTRTLTGTTASFALRITYINTTDAVDFTIRIAAPQCELGAFASTPIFPTESSPASATRTAEQLNITSNYLRLANTNICSILFEGEIFQTVPANNTFVYLQFDDNIVTNRIYVGSSSNTNSVVLFKTDSDTGSNVGIVSTNTVFKFVTTFNENGNTSISLNGSNLISVSNSASSNSFTTLRIGSKSAGADSLFSAVKRISIFPTPLDANNTVKLSG